VNPQRIKENHQIHDFALSEEEMKEISNLDKNYRFLQPFNWYQIPIFGEF
jgi:diketogulonate reductase-like aldo/keto reductase